MRINVTSVGLDKLIANLDEVPEDAHKSIRKAVQVTSHHIKDTAKEKVSGHPKLASYPYTITYDTKDLGVGKGVTAEIGPDLDRGGQAPLGGFAELEYGTPWSAPVPHLGPALDKWEPDFVKGLEIATADVLEDL